MTAANLGWCYGGFVTDKVVSFYQKRAEGEVGLIIAGAAGIDPVRVNKVGMMQVYDDRFIPGLKKLTDAVHGAGSAIFLQLMHAGAYAKQSEHNGVKAVAPSPLHSRFTREEAKELTKEEIREIIGYFGDAAMRAKTAGFDNRNTRFWSNENREKTVPFEALSSHKFARFHPIIESFRIVPTKARESHRNGIQEPQISNTITCPGIGDELINTSFDHACQ